MSREIRITVDDDEVFERMRRRKEERDLSWEEALRRGLGEPANGPQPPAPGAAPEPGPRRGPESQSEHRRAAHAARAGSGDGPSPFDPDFGERLRRRIRAEEPESEVEDLDRDGPPGPFSPGFGDWIQGRVEDAVHGAAPTAPPAGSLDEEIERLEGAEDAALVFETLDEPREVPLRIDVRSGPEGLDVDVVAVRQGKGTDGLNRFDEADRKSIARHLAGGETVVLRIAGGDVRYEVVPALAWGRDAEGNPTVTDVEITAVDLD